MRQSKLLVFMVIIFLGYTSCATFAQGSAPDPGSVQYRARVREGGNSGDDMSYRAERLSAAGQYSEAEQLFKSALAYWDKNPPIDPHSQPNCLNNFGLLYAKQCKYDQAIPFYTRALSLDEKLLSANDPLVALTLDNMAQAYRLGGKLQEAEPFYIKALAVEEKCMAPDDQDHAITMCNLSLLYFQLGQYDKCEPLMLQSLTILKRTLGEKNPDYLSVYNYYLTLLRKTNRSKEADKLELEVRSRLNH